MLLILNPANGRLRLLRTGWALVLDPADLMRLIEVISGLLTKSEVKW
jgi:hypothetical protein